MNQLGQEEPIGFGRLMLTTGLIAAVFVIWAFFFTPKQPGEPAPTAVPVSGKEQQKKAEKQPPKEEMIKQPPAPSSPAAPLSGDKEEKPILQNEDLRLEFSNKGAVLLHASLKKYKAKGAESCDDLVSPLAEALKSFPLQFATGDEKFDKSLAEALFHVEQGDNTISFRWADGSGNSAYKTFALGEKGYIVSYDAGAFRNGTQVGELFLTFGPGLGKLSKEQAKSRYYQQEYVGYEASGSFQKATRARSPVEPFTEEGFTAGAAMPWCAIADNYFTAIFMPERGIQSFKLRTTPLNDEAKKVHPADSDITLLIKVDGPGKLYLGPKDFDMLKGMNGQIFRMMNWGWSWFASICSFLLWLLKKLFLFCHNYGLAILLLTLIIKLAFYPFTQNSMVKMKEMGEVMKKLKPQVDKVKAKYKKAGMNMQSRAKMNEEIMALYQKEGVNPFGSMSGCLPMFAQLPFFWALFNMLPNAIDLRGAPFAFWIKDLSLPDPLYITPVVMGVSQLVSTKMTATQSVEPTQRMMLYMMPVMFTWFCLWAPSGLTIYWLANNLLTMGQQAIINKQVEKRALEAQKGRKSTPKGPSRPSHA